MSLKGKTFKRIVASLVLVTAIFASNVAMAVDYIGIGTVTGSTVNVRAGAGTGNEILGKVNYGTTYPALATQDGWFQISYNNTVAWICGSYFTVSPVSEENSRGAVSGDVVNIRALPSLSGDIITTVPRGTTLVIFGEEDGWYKISYQGVMGYISKDYFSKDGVIETTSVSAGQAIVDEALKHVGKAYVYGSSGPNAFDCSGLVHYVYRQFGYTLNRTAADQMYHGTAVAKSDLMPGDLVFFNNRGTSYIGHVGIYIGNNQMVHASTSSTGVIITDLDSGYYTERYAGARRIVK
ncbi:MAG: C40 family peptidase [Clostridia bacterium]|nr:C40 family peptidase [Clostridia bacterium]